MKLVLLLFATVALANPLANLAELSLSEGRIAEAGPLLRRARTIREKALGPYHPAVGHTLVYQLTKKRG